VKAAFAQDSPRWFLGTFPGFLLAAAFLRDYGYAID
jgi:hypothetical protein